MESTVFNKLVVVAEGAIGPDMWVVCPPRRVYTFIIPDVKAFWRDTDGGVEVPFVAGGTTHCAFWAVEPAGFVPETTNAQIVEGMFAMQLDKDLVVRVLEILLAYYTHIPALEFWNIGTSEGADREEAGGHVGSVGWNMSLGWRWVFGFQHI